ncbi:MAG TPA: LytTR family DNA-binding domain-containing protein, partial [Mucilaginibacter sp.]
MNIIIIEDERKTAQSLENIILTLKPDSKITGRYQSVESSVEALTEGPQPDLIFMDIQLADGLCFEIFKSVKVTSPVIFCTAFDEYSLEAFKSNGVDYVLKPFSKNDIQESLKKVDELKNFFQQKVVPDLGDLLSKLGAPGGKTSFLVFKNQKYTTVQTENIAFFYIRNDATSIMCFDRQEFALNQSLDQVAST